jgi:predicted nucleic acid-binding protein
MIVADANLLIHFVCDTPQTALARRVHACDPTWVAPWLWEAEVLNGLLVMHRAGLMSLAEATRAWQNAAMAITDTAHDTNPASILGIAHTSNLSAYDACYVALARTTGATLVTEDKQILRACPDVARSLKSFLDSSEEPTTVREKQASYRARRKRKADSP